jgi:hypothetical protein
MGDGRWERGMIADIPIEAREGRKVRVNILSIHDLLSSH